MDVVPLQLWTVLWMWHPYSCEQWMWHPYSCGQWYGCGPLTAMDSGMDVVSLQLWTVVWMWHPYSCGQWYGCGNLTVVDSGMDVVSLQLWTALGPARCDATGHSVEKNNASRELDWGVFTAMWV